MRAPPWVASRGGVRASWGIGERRCAFGQPGHRVEAALPLEREGYPGARLEPGAGEAAPQPGRCGPRTAGPGEPRGMARSQDMRRIGVPGVTLGVRSRCRPSRDDLHRRRRVPRALDPEGQGSLRRVERNRDADRRTDSRAVRAGPASGSALVHRCPSCVTQTNPGLCDRTGELQGRPGRRQWKVVEWGRAGP